MAKKNNKQKRISYAVGDKLRVKPIIISAVLVFVLLTGLMITFMIFMLPKSVESIAFRETEINIRPGQTIKPEVIILPSDAAKRDYRLTTSNPAICSVSPYNEIKGENKGEVTITATLVANESLFTTVKVVVIDTTTIEGADELPQNIKTNEEIDLNGIQIFEGNNALATTVDVTPTTGRVMVSPNVFKFETAGERKITFQAFDSSSIRRTYNFTLKVYNKVHISINASKAAKFSDITAAETTAQLAKALGITAVDDFNVELECQISITDDASQQKIEKAAIAVGSTYTVEISATDIVGNTDTQIFEHIAIYGTPTVSFSTEATVPVREDMAVNTVDFYEIDGEYTLDINLAKFASIDAAYFGITGIDSFGKNIESSGIKLTKPTFVVAGNDRYQMTLTVTDIAGNSVSTPIKLRVFDLPKISCKPELGDLLTASSAFAHISHSVYTNVDFQNLLIAQLGLKVTDYFGGEDARNTLSLAFENDAAREGETVALTITATDKLGNIREITINCKIYGTPTILYGGDDISDLDEFVVNKTQPDAFAGLTAIIEKISGEDSFGEELDLTIVVKDDQDEVVAFTSLDELDIGEYTITFSVTDRAGNMAALKNGVPTEKIPLQIYGNPIIEYTEATEVHVKLTEVQNQDNAAIATHFDITAKDSLGDSITLVLVITQHGTSITLASDGIVADGNAIYTFTFTATDIQGNTATLALTVKVYDAPTIENTNGSPINSKLSDIQGKTAIELAPSFGLSAKDSYEIALALELDSITDTAPESGTIENTSSIVASKTYMLEFSATDLAGNKATTTITVKVYDTPTLTVPVDTLDITNETLIIADLKTDILALVTEAKDSFDQTLIAIIVDEETVFNALNVTEDANDYILLTNSPLTVTIRVTDAAGNVATQQITITFIPPVQPES